MAIRIKLPSQKQFNGDRAQDYSITPIYNENSQKAFRVINNGIGIVPHVSVPANPNKTYVKEFHDPSIESGIVVGKGKHLNPAGSSTRGYGKKTVKKNHLGNVEKSFGQALPMAHGKGMHGGRKMLAPHHSIIDGAPTLNSRYHLMPHTIGVLSNLPHTQHGGDFSGVNKYGAYKGGIPNIIAW